MANKHLQQHNIWPVGWSTILWAITMIFFVGGLHARFSILERDFDKYTNETDKKIENLTQAIYDLRLADRDALTVVDNSNRVLGVATREPQLKVSLTPTKTPTRVPTVTVSPTP